MADKGIIFSGPMVRALLAGTKTQTRRLAKIEMLDGGWMHIKGNGGGCLCDSDEDVRRIGADYMPYAPGDRLYVRESCRAEERKSDGRDGIRYSADGAFIGIANTMVAGANWSALYYYRGRGKDGIGNAVPSIHMPRWASRLWLAVTDVRVQRLQDISEADAVAEGIDHAAVTHFGAPSRAYAALWNHLHSAENDHSWEANPWIVAITFTVNRGNIDG